MKENNKNLLFERMHSVGGMPLDSSSKNIDESKSDGIDKVYVGDGFKYVNQKGDEFPSDGTSLMRIDNRHPNSQFGLYIVKYAPQKFGFMNLDLKAVPENVFFKGIGSWNNQGYVHVLFKNDKDGYVDRNLKFYNYDKNPIKIDKYNVQDFSVKFDEIRNMLDKIPDENIKQKIVDDIYKHISKITRRYRYK